LVDTQRRRETMTTSVIETAVGNGSFALPGAGEQMLLLFARYSGREDIETRMQEEAAIDAEDILTQAEEAGALDPVG
jgi:hypothetical protein